ncbi:MAG: serine/threonine protein kinase [Acidobacteria bacterium]|nr:MAG: serine/threonine protein kinase [Acidobacteriota bacterium]
MLIEVSESSRTGEARRHAVACAQQLRFKEEQCGAVAIATTELATNLVKHAQNGRLMIQPISQHGHSCLRVIAIDSGPGIPDISRAMNDGHSTTGSMGSGLGAIRRLCDAFEIYSVTGIGTVIRADFWLGGTDPARHIPVEIGVVSEPIAGEEVCGDQWAIRVISNGMLIMIADGLGHGILANEAAQEATQVLAQTRYLEPASIVNEVHHALKKTRGAAVAVAKLDCQKKLLVFAGVGNISGNIVSPGSSRGLPSHNGTAGQHASRIQEFSYPWRSDDLLVMHSDGLASRWDMERYPGLLNKHASMIAAMLHRDFSRRRDDVTVFVAKVFS